MGLLSTHSESQNPSWFLRAYNLQPCSSWFPHRLQSSDSDIVFLFFSPLMFSELCLLWVHGKFSGPSLSVSLQCLHSVLSQLSSTLTSEERLSYSFECEYFPEISEVFPFIVPFLLQVSFQFPIWGSCQPLTLFNSELVSFLKFVKFELNIQEMKIMASSPITSWQIGGETVETVTDFIFWAPKSLQMVTAAMRLKQACSLEEKLWPT